MLKHEKDGLLRLASQPARAVARIQVRPEPVYRLASYVPTDQSSVETSAIAGDRMFPSVLSLIFHTLFHLELDQEARAVPSLYLRASQSSRLAAIKVTATSSRHGALVFLTLLLTFAGSMTSP